MIGSLNSKPEIKKLLQQKLVELKGLKFSLSYLGYFVIAGTDDRDCEAQKKSKNFPIFAPLLPSLLSPLPPCPSLLTSKSLLRLKPFS